MFSKTGASLDIFYPHKSKPNFYSYLNFWKYVGNWESFTLFFVD